MITPVSIINSIGSERSLVCLDLMAFKDCGKKPNVVKNAATNPIIKEMSKIFYCRVYSEKFIT